jgi:hypothetical protein
MPDQLPGRYRQLRFCFGAVGAKEGLHTPTLFIRRSKWSLPQFAKGHRPCVKITTSMEILLLIKNFPAQVVYDEGST